jgi:hypothetical protein
MTKILSKAKVVRVKIEEGKTGLFYASSSDMKGLLVAEPTIDALEQSIPRVISDMYKAHEVEVVATRAAGGEWIVIQVDEVRAALEGACKPL